MLDEQIRDRFVQEYLGETNDVLNDFNVALGNTSSDVSRANSEFSRLLDALSVPQVQESRLETKLLDITLQPLQRLHEYLDDLQAAESKIIANLKFYSPPLHDNDCTEADIRTFSRSLPVRMPIDMDNILQIDIEVVLIEPNKTFAKLASQELPACRCRVITLRGSIDASTYVIRAKPDMIITSVELDEISDTNLACAIGAMPFIQNILFAFLTSRDRNHSALRELPEASIVIKKDDKFSNSLADALARFDLL
jgi:hypothetical protein